VLNVARIVVEVLMDEQGSPRVGKGVEAKATVNSLGRTNKRALAGDQSCKVAFTEYDTVSSLSKLEVNIRGIATRINFVDHGEIAQRAVYSVIRRTNDMT
jgi:hypothetical protein